MTVASESREPRMQDEYAHNTAGPVVWTVRHAGRIAEDGTHGGLLATGARCVEFHNTYSRRLSLACIEKWKDIS